jgi:transcriptional regulator with XRE-family HTH domain
VTLSPDEVHEPDSVRSLRVAHGVSVEALARHCSLSVRQLRQIEEGGSDAFYSPAIKQLATHKVMTALKKTETLLALQLAMRRDADSPLLRGSNHAIGFKVTRPARDA